MKLNFDAELQSADGTIRLPVYCEIQPPYVGGQKALVHMAVPAQYVTENPPHNPCMLYGKSGAVSVEMQGVSWRQFPTASRSALGLESIELLHIESLTVRYPRISKKREIRFHLAPVSYLRSNSRTVRFGDSSSSKELFVLDLPGLGKTSFVAEWVTTYHRDAEIPGATVIAGFSAVADLPTDSAIHVDEIAKKFRASLHVLSVLFRQAVSLHGWTYTDHDTVSKWIYPLEPAATPCKREDRGDFVASPRLFTKHATDLVRAYEKANNKIRSLVERVSVSVDPHFNSNTRDRFLFMFSSLEKVIGSTSERYRMPRSPAATDEAVIMHLDQLQRSVTKEGGENASEISERLRGLISVVKRRSIKDKFDAFVLMYPKMTEYGADLWPVFGTDKVRGLKEVRDALSHGSSVPLDVLAVAEWHLAILLERVVFMLLDAALPDGISRGSFLLRIGGRGWYDRDTWLPLRKA